MPRTTPRAVPRFDAASVADVMHHGVVTCAPGASLEDVAELMVRHGVHCLVVEGLVADPDGGERLVWRVLDDLDLARALARDGITASTMPAAEAATGPGATVAPDDSLTLAASLIVANGLTHLVVATDQGGRPVGVVSALDLARALASARPGRSEGR
jgi:CBS domain-containing protein